MLLPPKPLLTLGIETSCDECSVTIVRWTPTAASPIGKYEVLGLTTFSQIELHKPYGGVVPEVASRNHLETFHPVLQDCLSQSGIRLSDIDCLSVTNRPGLVGALLVGVSGSKALAYALRKPLVAVHHLEGHLASLYLSPNRPPVPEDSPITSLLVSGGHTILQNIPSDPTQWPEDLLRQGRLGQSRDDAAGEAFDKTAKLLGLPYPGGKWIEVESATGDATKYSLPRALPRKDDLDFSFSGLKTAVSLEVQKLKAISDETFRAEIPNLAASIQEAITDVLVRKLKRAAEDSKAKAIAIVGGVSANKNLRSKLEKNIPLPLLAPPFEYCTDNAAMIGVAGLIRFQQGQALTGEKMMRLNAWPTAEI